MTTKHTSTAFFSMRNVIELVLPLLLGVFAIAMLLTSYLCISLGKRLSRFCPEYKARTREKAQQPTLGPSFPGCAIDLLSLTCYKSEFYWTGLRAEAGASTWPANGSNAAKPQTTLFLDVEARFGNCQ